MKFENDYIQRIIKGDEQAFKTFMEYHASHLFHYAFGFVKQKETAEEIVSDVFFEVWKMRENLAEVNNLKSWMITATHRKSISYIRRNVGKMNVPLNEIEQFVFDPLQSPDHKIISKEEMDKINAAIQKLPPKCRHVFFLAKIEGLAYVEIAKILGISVKTINNHIAHALEIISKNLRIFNKNTKSE